MNNFPDLAEHVEREDLRRVFRAATQWLQPQAGPTAGTPDWPAMAAVVVCATSHYWRILDVLGHHPDGIAQDRYVAALVALLVAWFDRQGASVDGK